MCLSLIFCLRFSLKMRINWYHQRSVFSSLNDIYHHFNAIWLNLFSCYKRFCGFFPHQTGPFKGIINQIKSIFRPRNSYFIVIFDGTHIFHFIFLFATINIRHVNVAWRHDIFTLFLSTIFQHNLCISYNQHKKMAISLKM